MSYHRIRRLDIESAQKAVEGKGPVDECLCTLLTPPEEDKRRFSAMRESIKRAFRSVGGGSRKSKQGPAGVFVPLTTTKGGRGFYSTKETIKHKGSCGKCGCDKEDFVLKHSYANIKIVTPDISSICPCPTSDCMPDKEKLFDNIKVTVERVQLHPDNTHSEVSLNPEPLQTLSEPIMEKRPISDLIEAQFDNDQSDEKDKTGNESDWSFGFEED
ncbi:uncharacterized protein LOC126378980 [Pectinophora gossypiella]|uniref:uncharacterized protein LOC126378980 n=1 Tax=Pectinophora gossypiella TaxID=13191 RepID=UPI00214E802D|nr:uncharacterized protein LOC126378980 [Pectinophora gossypiella]XP_049883508.1 uncharacterized protein LOC126378980 [Pectinophora gossypiella]